MLMPNLVYIFADQLRFSCLGCNGDEYAETPNLDSFSRCCTDMCNAVSGHPVCAPYRASLLTGKYTTKTGMVINEIRISGNHHTFADVLNENGFEPSY
ncbi:MAG: sulfatase-like hydrolase/transferase, partial [Clostridiales bacterium]|nr:sulfatase-like hydrolase/transferase [Clostridiales bacterium]